jgi:DNA-binding SARP family transcriptional activator
MDDERWEGQKPLLLFKALLARNPWGTPRDVLMEDLWPETAQEVAENNFKVFLHRLRKTLEPEMDKTFGSSYLHLKANLLFLDQDLCQVDLDELSSLIKQGEQQEQEGLDQTALALYKQALAVYRGDFLAEELYQPWAASRREELRSKHLDLLLRVAALHERRGALLPAIDCYKEVIRTDPLAEEAYQKLMLLYAQRGRRNAALRLYEDLRKALKKELDTAPEEVTQAIFRKIWQPD